MGFAGTLLPGVLWAQAQAAGAKKITKEMIENAAAIADVPISDEYKEMMLENLNDQASGYEEIYKLHMPNSVAPALIFDPVTSSTKFETEKRPMRMSAAAKGWSSAVPKSLDELAFLSVRQLAEWMRTKKISSLALTQMYLARLKKYDATFKFVVTLTEERALAQAKRADDEIAAGKYRGPLHGIPWGAKDLLAVKGYRTTWGAAGFEEQSFDSDATVVERLDAAGAVLVAKLTMGALAQGDLWFGARTRNPWNMKQGSSGSSAGSASATTTSAWAYAVALTSYRPLSCAPGSPFSRVGPAPVDGLQQSIGARCRRIVCGWSRSAIPVTSTNHIIFNKLRLTCFSVSYIIVKM